jgi:CMP-N,N'-diacetyllegionaminic acid synthase
MRDLFLITARGGSKGIPGKNIKKLGNKPLIEYSIDLARQFADDEFICVSTDDDEIVKVVEKTGLKVPFKRPAKLASDTAGSYEVILHALDWYAVKNILIDRVILFQPTSPFRLKKHVKKALSLYTPSLDMVVSVSKVESNLAATLFKENKGGLMEKVLDSKNGGTRRQDTPAMYKLNGAIYVMNTKSLRKKKIGDFEKIKKVEMDALSSVDIDVPLDWEWSEFILKKGLIKLDY